MNFLQITKLCVYAAQFFHSEQGAEPCATLPPPCVNEWRTEWACIEQPENSPPFTSEANYIFTKIGTYVMQLNAFWTSEGNSWQGIMRTDTFLIGLPPDRYLDEYFICDGGAFLPLPDSQPDFTIYPWDTIVLQSKNYAAITKNEFCSTVEYFNVEPYDCSDDVVNVTQEVYLPNAFSPNGDGINDDYRIHAPGSKLLNFTVYDRWGGLVSEQYPWDGGNSEPGVYLAKIALMHDNKVSVYRTDIILIK